MYKKGEHSWIRYIKMRIRSNLNFLALAEGSTGCSPQGTKVMLANGDWKNIEEIKIGDTILSPQEDEKYKYGKIIKTFKWKSKENYDVFQLNKQKEKLYSCSSNHEIPIWHKYPKRKGVWETKNISARELAKQNKHAKGHQDIGFSCPPIPCFQGRKNCEVEPYTLGVFLGDGMFRNKTNIVLNKRYEEMKRSDKVKFYNKNYRSIDITSADKEIMEEVSKHYPIMNVFQKKDNKAKAHSFSINGELSRVLTKYGLEGKNSGDKFIPKEALYSDIEYRKKLLAGLIDTDGYLSKEMSYSITTKSKQLAEDILFLIYSLGGRGRIKKIKKGIKRLNFIGEYYRVSFFTLGLNLPIKTKRKVKEEKSCYISANRVAIEVKPSKEEYDVYGFTVDTPSHFYITDKFMVSGNSGKSWGMLSVAYLIDPNFEPRQVAFSFQEVMRIINADWFKKKKWKIILFDEPQTSISNRQWQSLTNRLFNFLLSTFRHQNIVLLFATPYADFIDIASQKLLHCKFEVKGHSAKTNLTTIRPKLLQYNSRMRKFYEHSLWVMHEGQLGGSTKLTKWNVPKPPQHLIDAYEVKKENFTSKLNKSIQSQLDVMDDKQDKKDKKDSGEEEVINDTGDGMQFLDDKEKQWLEYIKTHPHKTKQEYGQVFKRHPSSIVSFYKKCRRNQIEIDEWVGK